jgi:hypothetical protein
VGSSARLNRARLNGTLRPEGISGVVARLLSLRLLLGIIAISCLAAQLASAAHFVIVEHHACAEHGELVHEGEASHRSARSVVELGAKGPRVQAALADDVLHGHEHCIGFSDRRENLAVHPQSVANAQRPYGGAVATLSAGTLDDPPAIPLLLLAPKASPPG